MRDNVTKKLCRLLQANGPLRRTLDKRVYHAPTSLIIVMIVGAYQTPQMFICVERLPLLQAKCSALQLWRYKVIPLLTNLASRGDSFIIQEAQNVYRDGLWKSVEQLRACGLCADKLRLRHRGRVAQC